jgi:hypothetical protein
VQEVHCPNGRSLQLSLSRAAQRALALRTEALYLELELYFSCLVRKRIHVRDSMTGAGYLPVTDKLRVRFRPVVTQTCSMREVDTSNPPLLDMPMVQADRYFPHWLTLDYRGGRWRAEFGYARAPG